MRSDSPSPSSASAPNGRCGPCTSSGEQVTSTTQLSRSSWSNFAWSASPSAAGSARSSSPSFLHHRGHRGAQRMSIFQSEGVCYAGGMTNNADTREGRAYQWIRTMTESPDRFAGTAVERAVGERIGDWMRGLGARDVALEPAPGAPRAGYVLALHSALALLGIWRGGLFGTLLAGRRAVVLPQRSALPAAASVAPAAGAGFGQRDRPSGRRPRRGGVWCSAPTSTRRRPACCSRAPSPSASPRSRRRRAATTHRRRDRWRCPRR